MNHTTVLTSRGLLQGEDKGSFHVFRGVPYAKPPIGPLRWDYPQPPEPWQGVRQALAFPSRCWQMNQEPGSFYHKEFYAVPATVPTMSEDCLYLNIWTPSPQSGEKLPVAFWVHGGAFINGYGSEIEFDGEAYCKRGIVLVTINYRLGAFGFLAHPWLSGRSPQGISGNYGIFDQLAALRWVNENITAFGGDPHRVTIMGQSAGAMSVQTLVSSPLSKGLVQGAVLQSAGGYGSPLLPDKTMAEAYAIGEELAGRLGASCLEDLLAAPAQTLMEHAGRLFEQYSQRGKGLPFLPLVDGVLLPTGYDTVVEQGLHLDIPYLIGSTKDDITADPALAAIRQTGPLHQACVDWCRKNQELGRHPGYCYHFSRRLLGDDAGAFHSADLWYMFGTLGRSWRPKEERDYLLQEEMLDAWAAFVKTGSPGWPAYSGQNLFVKEFS